jgi:hypothetical protein
MPRIFSSRSRVFVCFLSLSLLGSTQITMAQCHRSSSTSIAAPNTAVTGTTGTSSNNFPQMNFGPMGLFLMLSGMGGFLGGR